MWIRSVGSSAGRGVAAKAQRGDGRRLGNGRDVRHPTRDLSQFILSFEIEKKRLHVLVDVERISLLRKVVRANSTTHLGGFVFWLPVKCPP